MDDSFKCFCLKQWQPSLLSYRSELSLKIVKFCANSKSKRWVYHFEYLIFDKIVCIHFSHKKDSGKKPDGKTTNSCYCSNSSHIRVVWGENRFKKKEPVQWPKFREGAIQVTAQRLRVVHRHCKNFLISCYSIIQFSLGPGDSILCGMLL